jgi:hypothetical protein
MSILDIRDSVSESSGVNFTAILVPFPHILPPPTTTILKTNASSRFTPVWPAQLICVAHQSLFRGIDEESHKAWPHEDVKDHGSYLQPSGGPLEEEFGMYI